MLLTTMVATTTAVVVVAANSNKRNTYFSREKIITLSEGMSIFSYLCFIGGKIKCVETKVVKYADDWLLVQV